ncbi:MAG: acyl carrier protein [Coriobacteriales bacterium]|jgi:acyl carrier protein|nr:acyl carrier protein [Coriobacteriales bacterium]
MASSLEIIRQRLAEQMGIDIEMIQAETDIADDLGADSLDAVELIIALEDEFHLTIDVVDSEQLKTVGDVAQLVDRLNAG